MNEQEDQNVHRVKEDDLRQEQEVQGRGQEGQMQKQVVNQPSWKVTWYGHNVPP